VVNHGDNEYEQPEVFSNGIRLKINSRNSLSFSDRMKYQLDEYANELFQETPWKY
jgi:hypothetical protein